MKETNQETSSKGRKKIIFAIKSHHFNMSTAYFSAGCFWGVEYYFKRLKGVTKTAVRFMSGSIENPS